MGWQTAASQLPAASCRLSGPKPSLSDRLPSPEPRDELQVPGSAERGKRGDSDWRPGLRRVEQTLLRHFQLRGSLASRAQPLASTVAGSDHGSTSMVCDRLEGMFQNRRNGGQSAWLARQCKVLQVLVAEVPLNTSYIQLGALVPDLRYTTLYRYDVR